MRQQPFVKQQAFIHLRVHSIFSLLEGALPMDRLISLVLDKAMPAVGIADTANLFGALEFSEKAQAKGIQPIIGCRVLVNFNDYEDENPFGDSQNYNEANLGHIILYAMNSEGFINLSKLVSRSYLEAESNLKPHISMENLTKFSDGLIGTSGGFEGGVNVPIEQGEDAIAVGRLSLLKSLFGDRFYVELQRYGDKAGGKSEPVLVNFAYANNVPIVATNSTFFPTRDDYDAHDALLAISEGRMVAEDNRRKLSPENCFKSASEMVALFADLPEAIENTLEIAFRCQFRPLTHAPILPGFAEIGEGKQAGDNPDNAPVDEAKLLRKQAEDGLSARLLENGLAPDMSQKDYEDRLSFELNVIETMKFPGYFLIVADFIRWAKNNDVAVGPGRGSGAGSLVAWSLTITDIDPLRFGLLFERFLNPDRVSMPDFDIDFCQEKRDLVIRYVQDKYGASQVAQIITFGSLQARAVLRDVGRVLQMPYGQVDRLCKMVPSTPANPMTLKEAIKAEPQMQEAEKDEEIVRRLFSIATRLEGLYRHASTHAAGIVIGDRPLEELVPLYRDPRSDMPVTQYNMKWVEQAGLVKFDFLGLKTLTLIEKAKKLILLRGITVDLSRIDLGDPKTYEMLANGETAGVFQLESQGMRRALVGMKPDRFEDIIALVALYRPGPMDNIPTYNRRKHGLETPDYMHPTLEGILKETYGVIIYQEQVMQIAQELSGYTLGQADLLRRAMGKKIKAEMDQQRAGFVDGAVERGIDKGQANTIFDLVARFADYGFNKSHAAAYAMVAYHTAYLKANYPVEFLAASMTMDMGNTEKLSDFHQEAKRMGIKVLAPNVAKSGYEFDVSEDRILYAMGALKGLGQNVADAIVAARTEHPFDDISDFAERVDSKVLNKRSMEALICAGALDQFDGSRARLSSGVERILAHSHRVTENTKSGQDELFGSQGSAREAISMPVARDWDVSETLAREHKAVGLYLSAHPLDQYSKQLAENNILSWESFSKQVHAGKSAGKIAATIIAKQERRTRTGAKMGILVLSDPTGQFEATLYAERLSEYREQLEIGQSFEFVVGADLDDETDDVRVRIQSMKPIGAAMTAGYSKLKIFLENENSFSFIKQEMDQLEIGKKPTQIMAGKPIPIRSEGKVELILMLDKNTREATLELVGKYGLSKDIAGAIKSIPGVIDISLH
ncbi:MAG: DNA polymerase III subunit alpha [Hyphomicrobiales bacterium]|nr:MAG: DNA polymerase III subunit alpha [Hyphomicrobiales bacterium]